MLSEKFQNYQNSLKECFYHKDSTNSDSQEYREILGVVLEDRDLERDIATFSQIGNIEIKLTKKAEFDYNEYNANSQDDEVNRKKSKRDGYTEFKRTIRLIDMEKYILNENGSADIHKLDCGDQSVDSNIIEKIIDSSTSNNENSENVSMTPTTHRSGYSTKEYLDQVW